MSVDFRPTCGWLHELHAFVPRGVPLLPATATATPSVRKEVINLLDMKGCELVFVSPDCPDIYYEFRKRINIEMDFAPLIALNVNASRVIVYCRSLNVVADLSAYTW